MNCHPTCLDQVRISYWASKTSLSHQNDWMILADNYIDLTRVTFVPWDILVTDSSFHVTSLPNRCDNFHDFMLSCVATVTYCCFPPSLYALYSLNPPSLYLQILSSWLKSSHCIRTTNQEQWREALKGEECSSAAQIESQSYEYQVSLLSIRPYILQLWFVADHKRISHELQEVWIKLF